MIDPDRFLIVSSIVLYVVMGASGLVWWLCIHN